jgi:hypothetical protein
MIEDLCGLLVDGGAIKAGDAHGWYSDEDGGNK